MLIPANEVVREIGYGNAAGLLFTKGVSGPPGASVQEVKEGSDLGGRLRHPITGLEQVDDGGMGGVVESIGKGVATTATTPASVSVRPVSPTTPVGKASTTGTTSTADMTQEEKEVEAERLMTLFQRMERNPAMSMISGDAHPMRDMVDSGRMQTFEKDEAERERKRVEEEGDEDEEQALRELAQYKKRVKRV